MAATVSSWSPDGKYLFINLQNNATRLDVDYMELEGDRKLKPFLTTPANEGQAVLSPNGKWLAYMSDESGRQEVYVMAFPSRSGKWQVSNGGGNQPAWSADGKQLYYHMVDKLMVAPIQDVENFKFGAPETLPVHLTEFDAVGPAGTGERFPALKAPTGGQPRPEEVILNWTGMLKK